MSAKNPGAPLKRGTRKQHTTSRLERDDRTWIKAKAKAAGITPPDMIHALCEAARLPGSDAERIAALSAQLVFMENQMQNLAQGFGKCQVRLRDAQEKNFLLAQRLRAQHGAFTSLPESVQKLLPDMFLSKNRRVYQEAVVPDEERVVVL